MYIPIHVVDLPVRLCFERPVTDEELMDFSSANDGLRIERNANGELELMTPSGMKAARIEIKVCAQLDRWAEEDGRGDTLGPSAGITLPDTSVRAPDAAWISWNRWNSVTPAQQEGFAPVCPEFIIEVRSKSDRLKPLQEKMWMWLANGAELAWLIDPQRKVVEVYRPNEAPEIHQNPTSVLGTGPVAGFELVLARIWQ